MNITQIRAAFGKKLIGNKIMDHYVCQVLFLMPEQVQNQITSTTWFVSSFEDAYGFTFTGNDLKDNHLIFLSDELLIQNEEQIKYTIAHEIGHVVLNHRNAVLKPQSKKETEKQENEAHEFALKYL